MITLCVQRRNPRSPCVGIDGYFDRRRDIIVSAFESRAGKLEETVVHSEEDMKGLSVAAVLHFGLNQKETERDDAGLGLPGRVSTLDTVL